VRLPTEVAAVGAELSLAPRPPQSVDRARKVLIRSPEFAPAAVFPGGTFAAYPRVAARVVEDDVADAMSGVHWCPVGTASAGRFRLQKDPVRCTWGQVASRQPPEMEKR
jgi:hypothetical protein